MTDLSQIPEKTVEKKVCDFAKAYGWANKKYKTENERSAPDRIFLRRGVAMFIEFKRYGKRPTVAQANKLQDLRDLGFTALWVDQVEIGKQFFRDVGL